MTKETLNQYHESERTIYFQNRKDGLPINPVFSDKGYISKQLHWTEATTENHIVLLLSAIVSQSFWDLGFKESSLLIECIFYFKFVPF